ncbi:hypothetical protein RugamoR57_37330 [Duganella caerulea]|uniref:hypothetical protein n=1 Tax=Duganella caerulea TaxID=2885762 RepID=UPI0030E95B62
MKTSARSRSHTVRAKFAAARRSATVLTAGAVPILLAIAESLRDQLPAISTMLTGWPMVGLSVVVSTLIAFLRVRSVRSVEHDGGSGAGDGDGDGDGDGAAGGA